MARENTITEEAADRIMGRVAAHAQEFEALQDDYANLAEGFADLELAIEMRGWQRGDSNRGQGLTGLKLDQLQKTSEDIRAWIVAGGLMKRLAELRGLYIFSDGFGLTNVAKAKSTLNDAWNKAALFSIGAAQEVNRAWCSDGTAVFLVNKKTQKLIRVPFDELAAPYTHTDNREVITYLKRSWKRPKPGSTQFEDVMRYYRTDLCPTEVSRASALKDENGTDVPVDQDWIAVVHKVNGQTGWTWGIPDLFPSLQWAEKYSAFLKGQAKFADSLSTIAWHFKSKSDAAIRKAAATKRTTPGESIATSTDTEAKPLQGASAVSFSNGAPLAAQAAAAAEVSVIAALADPSAAGNGASASEGLEPSTLKMARARRDSFAELVRRIFDVLGGAPNLQFAWPDLEDESPFRLAEMMAAAWNTGLFSEDEIRPAIAHKVGIELKDGSKAPDGVLLPNNIKSVQAQSDVTTKAAEKVAAAQPAPVDDGTTSAVANKDKTGKKASAAAGNGQGRDKLGAGKLSKAGNNTNVARDKGEFPSSKK